MLFLFFFLFRFPRHQIRKINAPRRNDRTPLESCECGTIPSLSSLSPSGAQAYVSSWGHRGEISLPSFSLSIGFLTPGRELSTEERITWKPYLSADTPSWATSTSKENIWRQMETWYNLKYPDKGWNIQTKVLSMCVYQWQWDLRGKSPRLCVRHIRVAILALSLLTLPWCRWPHVSKPQSPPAKLR